MKCFVIIKEVDNQPELFERTYIKSFLYEDEAIEFLNKKNKQLKRLLSLKKRLTYKKTKGNISFYTWRFKCFSPLIDCYNYTIEKIRIF